MKIYLIHGEYKTKSYEKLNEYLLKAKEKKWIITRILNEDKLSISEVLSSNDLFNKNKVFILDNLSKISQKNIDFINDNLENLSGILILYSDSKVNQTTINKFKNLYKIEEFELPKIIYKFLESFYPGNSKTCINLFHQLLNNEKIEFIFYLLPKYLRDLYWVKTYPSKIPYPSWRVDKLERQASKFTINKLKKIINLISEIDIKSKTSDTNLIDLLDFLIITKLE